MNNYNSDFSNSYEQEHSFLSVGLAKSSGRKIAEWDFCADRKLGKPAKVAVILKEQGGKLCFMADCDLLPNMIIDSDIESLRRQVEAELRLQVDKGAKIAWENWLEVVVTGSNSNFDDSRWSGWGANLKVEVKRLKRGVHPDTGEVLTINSNSAVVAFPKALTPEETATETGKIRLHEQRSVSHIPDTQENRDALGYILGRLTDVRGMLQDMLGQNRLDAALRDIAAGNGQLLLPGGSPEQA